MATLVLTALVVGAPSVAAYGYGVDVETVHEARALGAKPAYATFWVGEWTSHHGWHAVDDALRNARDAGATPVIHWYYWGDDISPHAVQHGVGDKQPDEWWAMTHELARRVGDVMGDGRVVIVLETEFNKGGVETWEPFEDMLLRQMHVLRQGAPGAEIVLGFGSWGQEHYHVFDRAVESSDYVGFQVMRGSTRSSMDHYRDADDKILETTKSLKARFGKPVFLTDLALSSYGGPEWERAQAEEMREIVDREREYRKAGLRGVCYRSLTDNYMDPKNYFGPAESHWGVITQDGWHKPAADALLDAMGWGK